MYRFIRALLWKLEPEKAHHLALNLLKHLPGLLWPKPIDGEIHAMGLAFPHAVGLSAGFDTNASYLNALSKLGFSFIEVGGVTPKPQAGNPKPRLFRLKEANALINRMGFCNDGVDALVARIQQSHYDGILGINIGKNKETSLDHAVNDYLFCLKKVYTVASYVTINISSPNMPQLRDLQQSTYFYDLMSQLREEQLHLADMTKRYVPMVVKLSPDESDDAYKRMASTLVSLGIDGIIVSNTTTSRQGVNHLQHGEEIGGLSGQPLAARANACLQMLKAEVGDVMTLIASGGIDSPEKALQRRASGATLLQVYSGLVYQGPWLIHQLTKALRNEP
jgi:dihydroorotate dehydrogenase